MQYGYGKVADHSITAKYTLKEENILDEGFLNSFARIASALIRQLNFSVVKVTVQLILRVIINKSYFGPLDIFHEYLIVLWFQKIEGIGVRK